jgi:hypothetical protein
MANYIGKEPAQAPLTTDDIANGAVTAPKLAAGAAVSNIGYTPLNKAGDTMTGNLVVQGTTSLQGTATLGVTNITDNATVSVGKTLTLGQDPAGALQAVSLQYLQANYQLATGQTTTLLTDSVLTAASARVIEYTSTAEFVTVTLPNATTLTISNGKFVFRNEGRFIIGVLNSAGDLIGAIGNNSTAVLYLNDNSTAAGSWAITGDDVRPFFISNANTLPQSGTAVSDTLLSTAYATVVRLTSTSYVVIHNDNTATNQQIIAYAVDTSVKPASVGSRTVLAALSASSGVGVLAQPVAYRVSDTQVYVFNGSSTTAHVILTVTGTSIAVSNTLAGTFATIPLTHNPILGEITPVQQITDDLFLFAYAASAAAIVYYAVKIDSTTIRISTTVSSPQVNGTGFAGLIDTRLINYDAGTGIGKVGVCHTVGAVSPWALYVNRVTVTRNSAGAAPSLAAVDSVAVTGSGIAATANFGFAVDSADPQYGAVFYYAVTTVFPTYNGVYNLGTGTLTSTAASIIIATAGVATGFQRYASVDNAGAASATTAGLIGNARGLLFDQYGTGAWRAYLQTATSTRFIKIAHVGVTYSATLADFACPDGTNTVSAMAILGGSSSRYLTNATNTNPAFAVLTSSAMTPAAGQLGGAKLYVMFDESNKINLSHVFAPSTFSIRDGGPTLIGLQYMTTKSGYFVIPVGAPTAATTSEGSFNTWAFFKLGADGGMRYFGNWPLPIKNTREVVFNGPFSMQDNEINICSNGIEFDQVEGIHYRKFLKIMMANDA